MATRVYYYRYNDNGNLKDINDPNGSVTTYDYDDFGGSGSDSGGGSGGGSGSGGPARH